MKAPFFENVTVGQQLPAIVRPPLTVTQLVLYCGAAGVFDPIHFDVAAAKAAGFDDLIANGSLRVAFLTQLLTSWALPEGWIERLACQHRAVVLRGDSVTSAGRVTGTRDRDGVGLVDVEIWNETARGRTDIGTATVRLPRRTG